MRIRLTILAAAAGAAAATAAAAAASGLDASGDLVSCRMTKTDPMAITPKTPPSAAPTHFGIFHWCPIPA